MTQSTFMKRSVLFLLIAVLSLGMILPVVAVEAVKPAIEKISVLPKLPHVKITVKSTMELKQANILPTSEGKTVVFTLTVHNKENSDLLFIDYWMNLRSKGGTLFSVKLIEADKTKNRIPAQSSKDFTFYSTVNSSVQLQDLLFQVIKWDFSQSSYKRKLGEFTIPKDYAIVTPLNYKRFIDIGGTLIKSSVSEITVDKSEEYYLATIEYELENTGSRSVKLPAYQFYIRTADGTIFQLDTASLENVMLQPKEKKKLELKASISLSIKPENWQLAVTLADGTDKVDLPVAFYLLPATKTDSAPSTPIADKKVIVIDKVPVSTYLSRMTKELVAKNNDLTLYFNYENTGNKAVKIPKYAYTLKTAKGVVYPLNTADAELTVNPGITKEIELAVSVPSTVDIVSSELLVKLPVMETNKFEITAGTYKVPTSSTTEGVSLGQSYQFTNKQGTYTVKLNAVRRLPWEDQDIISADIKLSNKGLSALALPTLSGYFMFDGVKGDVANTKLVKLDNVMGLQPGAETNLLIYVKIPYTYEYKDIKLVLQETQGTGETATAKTLVEFKHKSELLTLPMVTVGAVHNFTNIGKRAGVKIRNVHTYSGSSTNLFYAEVEMENLEKRLTKLSKIEGYFKTPADVYFQATLAVMDKGISPNGKVLLSVWSKLPKNVDIPTLQLIVGEGLKEGVLATSADTSDAFMKAVAYMLPAEVVVPKSSFTDLPFYPYTLSLSKVKGSSNSKITFNYKLSKDSAYEAVPAGHNLVLEFVDGGVVYAKEFEFEAAAADTPFKLGDYSGEMLVDVDDLFIKIGTIDSYTLNVYDQFEGHRKLIATRTLNWFQLYD